MSVVRHKTLVAAKSRSQGYDEPSAEGSIQVVGDVVFYRTSIVDVSPPMSVYSILETKKFSPDMKTHTERVRL